MRTRTICVAAGLAAFVLLLLAGSAVAGSRSFSGAVAEDDATTVTLKIKKRDGKWSLTGFVARNFLMRMKDNLGSKLLPTRE